jgi:hypothetical protein
MALYMVLAFPASCAVLNFHQPDSLINFCQATTVHAWHPAGWLTHAFSSVLSERYVHTHLHAHLCTLTYTSMPAVQKCQWLGQGQPTSAPPKSRCKLRGARRHALLPKASPGCCCSGSFSRTLSSPVWLLIVEETADFHLWVAALILFTDSW